MKQVLVYHNEDQEAVNEAYRLLKAQGLHPTIFYEPRTSRYGRPYQVGNVLVPEGEHEQALRCLEEHERPHAEAVEELAHQFHRQVVWSLFTLAGLILLWAVILRLIRESWDQVGIGELTVVPVLVLLAFIQFPRLTWKLMTRTFGKTEDR